MDEQRPPYTDDEIRRFAAAWLFLCSRGYHEMPHRLGEVVRCKDADRANRIASGADELPERIAARLDAARRTAQPARAGEEGAWG
jgi:hypothetical protein